MDIATIAKAVVPLLLSLAKDTIGRTLNPTELEKALIAGMKAAIEPENKCPSEQRLFHKSAPDGLKGVPAFLKDFFHKKWRSAVIETCIEADLQFSFNLK